ncbi:arabinose efflux permease family protein [Burkholderiales bacterium JOSHI_001]|nr:arabinose efflux permease family protein [Burkholderiales bacterium JOSHI_001]
MRAIATTARVAEAGFSRVLAALIGGQMGLHSAMAGLRMAAPLQLLRDGASPVAAGAVMALFALAPVLLALPAGRLADRHGYHRPMRWAVGFTMGGCALAVAAAALPPGPARLALLCGAAALCGAGCNIGLITIQRSAGRSAKDNVQRMRVFSWLGMAPSLANALGPVAAGLMIDLAGFGPAYALLLALPLITALTARRVPPEAGGARAEAPAPARESLASGVGLLLRLPGMKRLLGVNWLLSASWDVHTFIVPLLGHERGLAASTIGLILGSFTAAVTAVRLLIPLLAHRVQEVRVLRVAMVWTGAVFALYPLAHSAWAMAGLSLLLGLSLGAVQPMVMATLHHITPTARHGMAIALRSMVMNASGTVLPLACGAVGAAFGLPVLLWVAAAAVAAGQGWAAGLARHLAGGAASES